MGRKIPSLKSIKVSLINKDIPEKKYLFIHNQAFEFQFMKSVFNFSDVMARKSHKVMTSFMDDYNFIVGCKQSCLLFVCLAPSSKNACYTNIL